MAAGKLNCSVECNPLLGPAAFDAVDSVLILACGTSYYAGCTAKYWLEGIAKIPTSVEVARPTLDDVFLALTGRSLRDGDAETDHGAEPTAAVRESAATTRISSVGADHDSRKQETFA